MIPRFRTSFRWSEIAGLALSNWDAGRRASSGALLELEEELASAYSVPQVVVFPYARVAIRAFLETGIEQRARASSKPRRAVLSAFNCVALGNALVSAGWKPLYVDTEDSGFNQDATQFLETLEQPEASLGIPVSEWGIRAQEEITRSARKPLLYDFALGGLDPRPPLLRDQDAVVYSLGWGKPLGGIRGAFLGGKSREVAQRWRNWRDARMKPAPGLAYAVEASLLQLALQPRVFRAALELQALPLARKLRGQPGGPSLPSDWNRLPRGYAIEMALRRLRKRDSSAAVRAEQIRFYRQELASLTQRGLALPAESELLSHFPVRTGRRERIRARLLSRGIFTSSDLFSSLLPDYPWLAEEAERKNPLPRARGLTQTTLHLPLYPGLDRATQSRVVEELHRSMKGEGR